MKKHYLHVMTMPVSQSLFRRKSVALLLLSSLLNQSTNLASSFILPPTPPHHPSPLSQTPPLTTPEQIERAKLAFNNFSTPTQSPQSSSIDTLTGLQNLLAYLNIDDYSITPTELQTLFSYLDTDGDGSISLAEFLNWYYDAAETERQRGNDFRGILTSRRTVNAFDTTPVDDGVLRRAVECAIAAPNRSRSEPWRFVKVGGETVARLQELNAGRRDWGGGEQQRPPLLPEVWAEIPGWCVVTSKVTKGDAETELKDFRSTSCAMQNFMLSMWSEGVGSKWTEGPMQKTQEFADIVGIDTKKEKVVGIIWYGFTTGGLTNVDPKQERRKGVDEVLSILP